MPSSANSMGEVHLPTTMSEANRKTEVRRRVDQFIAQAPDVGGEKVMSDGYETWTYDPSRPILYDRQDIIRSPEGQVSVQTTLDRRLHRAKPWKHFHVFQPEGLAPEAFDPTDGSCVPHQLHKLVKKRGQAIWTLEQVETLLRDIASELYPDEDLDD